MPASTAMPKLSELYARDMGASLNPVVSTGNLDAATVKTEIGEYVFTVDVVNGLVRALDAIRSGAHQHNGIWISGYFGSGKSHFLKYASYCLENREGALDRVAPAVAEHDPLQGGEATVSPGDWKTVSDWIEARSGSICTILFNMGTSAVSNAKAGTDFLTVFWGQFNRMRGYCETRLPLAAYLEKPLDKAGKFEDFKAKIAEMGGDWERDRDTMAGTKLDKVLEAAKEVWPEMTVEAVKHSILGDVFQISVASFMADVKDWIDSQGRDARLVFCADEVSQYIGNRSSLLLQLQEIVTGFHNFCGGRVWLMCTSQQKLDSIASDSGLNATSEDYGKIMSRFPVMVQLSAAATEFITRERVLGKTPAARVTLRDWYGRNCPSIDALYEFPAAYPVYGGEDDFVATYPFLDCHLKLVGQVLHAFRNRGFTVESLNSNARSVLGATLDVAKATKDRELGTFIAFDEFYDPMFADGLTTLAHSVRQNADTLVEQCPDKKFARRVLNTLFMVCHLDGAVAQVFPATLDNIVSLMLDGLSVPRKTLRDRIEAETDWLCSQNVLMRERDSRGVDRFKFYSRVEAEIKRQIKSIVPGSADLAAELESLVGECLGSSLRQRVKFHSSTVAMGMDVMGRHILAHNPDISVDLRFNAGGAPLANFALTVSDTTLVFFLDDLYNRDPEFRHALSEYASFNLYSRQNRPGNDEESAAVEGFRIQYAKSRATILVPKLEKMLVDAPILSGQNQITIPSATKAAKRFDAALERHLEALFPESAAAASLPHNAQMLANDISTWQPPMPGAPLGAAEQIANDYLDGAPLPLPVSSAVDYFRKRPYGWDEYATLAALARLVATERRRFVFNGTPGPDRQTVAANLASKPSSFAIAAASAVPIATMQAFVDAMRKIFGHVALDGVPLQAQELARKARELLADSVAKINAAEAAAGGHSFAAPLAPVRAAFESWRAISDEEALFCKVSAEAAASAPGWDTAKQIAKFTDGSQWEKFRSIERYASENSGNAGFLGAADKAKFDILAKAGDSPTPWSNLPDWIRLRSETDKAFAACRDAKRAEIARVYDGVFDALEELASNVGVPRSSFSERASTIADRSAPDSLMALENAINSAQGFKSAETDKILAAVPTTSPAKDGAVAPAVVKSVTLAVSHAAPLRTEADVDAYLAKLKDQLMREIAAGAAVVVSG